jgi:hypothetical protein
VLEKMVSAEGIEPAQNCTFNNLQSNGRHPKRSKYPRGSRIGMQNGM